MPVFVYQPFAFDGPPRRNVVPFHVRQNRSGSCRKSIRIVWEGLHRVALFGQFNCTKRRRSSRNWTMPFVEIEICDPNRELCQITVASVTRCKFSLVNEWICRVSTGTQLLYRPTASRYSRAYWP